MPEVTIKIGGRSFDVACQDGEQEFLHSAAKLLDDEISVMADQLGRVPEARMLLMAGLLLADKTLSVQASTETLKAEIAELKSQVATLESRPAERVEVPVIPAAVGDGLAELAARAEALAEEMEQGAS
ncbi:MULTISPECIES: cell division protein ZapA [unclassified Meridianimarinicoccus]|uniref:cell division protein ZapA n=1 Tax=unclassified Meridianimarinicoccus TaxID=2923344 RepID=UPI00186733AA|nr:cell division protein ZapA [Fluviibacterium sp. MJW13]